jgi:hypothetical protein
MASQVVVGEQLGLSSFFILVVKYVCGSLDLLLAPLLIILLNQEVRLGLGVLYRSVYTGSLDLPLTPSSSFCSTRRSGLASASSTGQCIQGPWTFPSPPPHHSAQPGGQAWPRRPLQVSIQYRVPGPPPRTPPHHSAQPGGQARPRRPLQVSIYRVLPLTPSLSLCSTRRSGWTS